MIHQKLWAGLLGLALTAVMGQAAEPTIDYSLELKLTYTGVLYQSTDGVNWTKVEGAVSPYYVPVEDAKKMLFCSKDEEEQPGDSLIPGENGTIPLSGTVSLDINWISVSRATFLMGSPKTEDGRFEDELQHPVKLTKGFWLGKYEVTQEQWTSVMGSNNSRFKGENRPVDSVSWGDCQAFIRKVNGSLGGTARLPTEAEWEYACRAGSSAAVSGSGHLDEMAWYDKNSESQTHEVGKGKQPNEWGFYDMHGNVLEWCSDWFGKAEEQEAVDPKGPTTGSFRVLRGGCWFYFARDCRSAYRLKRAPDIRNCVNGFRLACSPSADD